MSWQLTGTSHPCSKWSLLNTSGFFKQLCNLFIALDHAAACRGRWDSGIGYSGVTNSHGESGFFSHPAGVQLRKREESQESSWMGQLLEWQLLQEWEGTRQALQEGSTPHFGGVKTLTVHARNQERSIPGSTHLPWMGQATPECSQGSFSDNNSDPPGTLKTMAGRKKNLSEKLHFILLGFWVFFSVGEFTLMNFNLKRPGKTTCKKGF